MASRIVLITGANSGVGYAAAKVIASASEIFHVIMAGRSLEKANTAKSEIETAGGIRGRLSTVQLDVLDETSIQQAAKSVDQEYGRLDVLVNNAAIGGTEEEDVTTRFRNCLNTNVIGPVLVASAFRPLLLKSPQPYSIYVSSGAGSFGRMTDTSKGKMPGPPNGDSYQVSKAALNMVAVLDWIESQSTGLKVFAMTPGFVVSNLRGTSEELRSGWGQAGDPDVAGQTLLSIIQGERDADIGKFISKDGVYPW